MKKFIRKYILMAFAALLSLAANAAEPDWSVNANDYQYDMTVFAALSINGQTVSPDNYTLAAFCGEECRGIATVANSDGDNYFYLRIRSNVKTGETITFRAYNKTADEEVKQHWLLSTLAFEADSRAGFPSAPYVVTFQIPSYKVSIVASENGTIEGAGEYEEGSEVTLKAIPNEGYKFVDWSDGVTDNPYTFQVWSDTELSANFAPESYKVTYMIGEDVIRTDVVEYGSALPEAPAAPEKEGHTFAGWSEHPETMPAHDLTITGSYTVNKYKLTYVIGEETISETEVDYGSAITAIEAPEKEGYTFDGWVGVPETMPAHDVTVTGSYTINSYMLVFMIGDDVVSESTVEYASTIVEPTAPEKEGHTFAGWEEHTETMPAHDLVITGSYTVNIYTVTYIIEDGEVVRVDDVEFGAILPEAPEAPVRKGYDFKGWTEIPETMPAENITIVGSYEITTGISTGVIVREDVVYDIRGNIVKKNIKSLPTGVYIINGRKVMIK